MRDALALAAAAVWFALNIVLWLMRLPDFQQFALSFLLAVVFFAGFFLYLGFRDRRNSRLPEK
jgi:hypothetical protein